MKSKPVVKKTTRPPVRNGSISLSASAEVPQDPERVRRGQGETVAITIRLPREQWIELRNFAMHQGETLQTIAMNGFNRELMAHGYPELDRVIVQP